MNPWHDGKGRFCSGPRGIYTSPNSDGTVYVQFFRDKDCTDEYDYHEITNEELEETNGDVDKAIENYLGMKKAEKINDG